MSQPDEQRLLLLGFRRGGSSHFYYLMSQLLKELGHSSIDIVKFNHDMAIPLKDISRDEIVDALRGNKLIGVFRDFSVALDNINEFRVRPILLVRDPRDCLLSWMFAGRLHRDDAIPPEDWIDSESFDEFLKISRGFFDAFSRLIDFTKRHHGKIVKYEDLVERPIKLLGELVEFMELRFDRSALDLAVVNANFLQFSVDAGAHNRSGRPFQALETLTTKQLEGVNQSCSTLLEELGYPLSSDARTRIDWSLRFELDAMKRFMLVLARENAYRIQEIEKLRQVIESNSK